MKTITKSELREKLVHRKQLAIHKVGKPKYAQIKKYKHAEIAKKFLQDYSMFKDYLDIFDKNQRFTLISSRTSYNYKSKENTIILFDSFTITLHRIDDDFFIHIIAEYMLK